MSRRRSHTFLAAAVLLMASCGGPASDPASEASPANSTGLAGTIGASGATGAAAATGTTGATAATGATGGECTPEAPTASSWQTHAALSGDFTISFPAEWEDVSGDIGATSGELLSPETLAELGLTGSEPAPADVVRDPVTGDNLGVFWFDGATSSTEDVYAIQEGLSSTLAGIELGASGLTACVGGATAIGMELIGTVAGEGTRYQQLWFLVRDGTLYHFYLDAADSATADVLDEVVRTWEWTT